MIKKNMLSILFITFTLTAFSQCDKIFYGEGTFYGYGGGGNCSFETPESPVYTGAMNQIQYDSSNICGTCVEVTGPIGTVAIRIEDRCPECKFGDIDLSEDVFPLISKVEEGRVPISWKIIPCPFSDPIKFYIKEGSTQYWTAVQIRNHKYPIADFAYLSNGQWIHPPRTNYNYFMQESGMGPGPYTFMITDVFGHEIIEENIPLIVTENINGTMQFDDCINNPQITTIGLELIEGWNLISINVQAENMSIPYLFPNATTVKNDIDFYEKNNNPRLNTIDSVEVLVPYLIYNNVNEQIDITGALAISPKKSVFNIGWNMFAFPLDTLQFINDKVIGKREQIEIIKNFDAFWDPDISWNSLRFFVPNHSYFVKTKSNLTIEW